MRMFLSLAILGALWAYSADVRATGPAERQRILDQAISNENKELGTQNKNIQKSLYPIFVFIPGVLGSVVEECKTDFKDCKIIWGKKDVRDSISLRDLTVKDGMLYRTYPLLDFITIGTETNVYKSALTHIHNLQIGGGGSLLVFSYDWRKDNRESAAELHEFLCANSASIGPRPVIFVAHSMGGLVLKYWHKNIFTPGLGCSGSKLDIKLEELIFAGTPHYGAPKSIRAFANGYDLQSAADSVFGYFRNTYVKNTIEKELNRAGATFQSAYQLLPIRAMECADGHPDPGPRLRRVDTFNGGAFSLFDPEAWRAVGWPKHLPPGVEREKFYKSNLPGLLEKGKAFQCSLLKWEPNVKVTYFYGTGIDTDESYTLIDGVKPAQATAPRANEIKLRSHTAGDGTVPREIAQDFDPNVSKINRNWQSVREAHQDILESMQLFEYVDLIYRLTETKKAERLLRDEKFKEPLKRAYLKSGYLLESGPKDTAAHVVNAFNLALVQAGGRGLDKRCTRYSCTLPGVTSDTPSSPRKGRR
jgi:hypothetical protein